MKMKQLKPEVYINVEPVFNENDKRKFKQLYGIVIEMA